MRTFAEMFQKIFSFCVFSRVLKKFPSSHAGDSKLPFDDNDQQLSWLFHSYLIFLQPTHYLTISSHGSDDTIDSGDVEKVQLKKLVGQMKTNLCNISILSEPDLELLSNMDPNHVADITGRDFVEQLKETSGR